MTESIEKINQKDDCSIYYSSGKNELILLHDCKSYSEGFQDILCIHEQIPSVLKTSTIFTVQEKALDTSNMLYSLIDPNERISCRLRCFVRNHKKATVYLDDLSKTLANSGAQKVKCHKILGSADFLVEIDNIFLCKLLTLYKTGNKLTHMHPDYSAAWYNIETEFLI